MRGLIISGEFGKVLARQRSDALLEIGELLKADGLLLQVTGLLYGSQISQQNLELISGMQIEEGKKSAFYDEQLRNYHLALLRPIAQISKTGARLTKRLPGFMAPLEDITEEDLSFITAPKNPLPLGTLRSGSKVLDLGISLPGEKVLAHHILIPATTGRGKSNLTSCLLWSTLGASWCGFLVLDPHDEYYGRNGPGLKDHPQAERLVYYTAQRPPPGAQTLRVNIKLLRPQHFDGVTYLSPPQREAMAAYYKRYGEEWVEAAILDKPVDVTFHEGTLGVVKRKLLGILDLDWDGRQLRSDGVFVLSGGETFVAAVCDALGQANTVVVDTSTLGSRIEILVGSLLASEVFRRHRHAKMRGEIDSLPVVSIVLEEAPRVLGKEVLERGSNIFSTIAREGRKFKVGLTAITQLPSLIPRQILANMNTKIILGLEMAPERQAIIDSASQDLSQDDRAIASLDVGEAIVTSNFAMFAIPVKVPYFKELVAQAKKQAPKKAFTGISS